MSVGRALLPAERTAVARPSARARLFNEFPGLIGQSAAFRGAVEMARRAAAHASNVLLIGETGTGKELFARGIHYASSHAGEPFVAINCAAIPETMLESELFGHERGAFTDARNTKRGLLEVAGRGTVMLDEVNELPLNLQPKLLRVLEERRVRRLGAVIEYNVNCRIITATNKDLSALVDEGSFRSDLYYRLSVVRVELPPLRDRDGDIEFLAAYFVDQVCTEHNLPPKRLCAEAMAVLDSHAWLGNIRELKNTIESAIVMCDGDIIRAEHIRLRKRASVALPGDVILTSERAGAPLAPTAHTANGGGASDSAEHGRRPVLRLPPGGITLDEMERLLIEETIRHARGNRSLAARMLGISRPTIARKIERYRIA